MVMVIVNVGVIVTVGVFVGVIDGVGLGPSGTKLMMSSRIARFSPR
jgi:hypothetical protein